MKTREDSGQQPAVVIEATHGWGALGFGEVWRHRELAWFLTARAVKSRYRQMALGPLWILLQPLFNAVIYSVVFGRLAQLPSEGVPYPLFVYTAMLPWTFFSSAVVASSGSLVNQMAVISKIYFPRMLVPISAVLAGVVDMAFSFVVMIGMLAYFGVRPPAAALLLLPAYGMLAAVTALAIGLWTATLAVKFRDVKFAVANATRAWMYATPVAYSASLVPSDWLWLYRLNPMYWVVEGFRWGLIGVGNPAGVEMAVSFALVLLALISGAFVFRRTEKTIVDLL